MLRPLIFSAFLTLSPAAFAMDHSADHKAGHAKDHEHETHDHDHGTHDHSGHDHSTHEDHTEHMGDGHDHTGVIALSRTAEVNAALETGGTPVVVEVLGAVCDFCAKAMNKTFGKRDDVSAVYVDLDTKTLNLVLVTADAMDDAEISKVVKQSGYKAKAVHRGSDLLGGSDASNPT